MIELSVMLYPEENGTFQHVSGMKFDLNESVDSTVKLEESTSIARMLAQGKRRNSRKC